MSRFFRDPDERGVNHVDRPSMLEIAAERARLDREGQSRRAFLKGSAAAGVAGLMAGGLLPGCASVPGLGGARLGFRSVPVGTADKVSVPDGYEARVLIAWGDPIGSPEGLPAFKFDASNTWQEQMLQSGMHHDGMYFFPLEPNSSTHALLVMNHEYQDDGLLHVGGFEDWSADKVKKSQASLGCAVLEVRLDNGAWNVVRPSRYARRITAMTPMAISGPAAGHALMKTKADADGRSVLGTFANCANGWTPWGTYLTCEENFNQYFMGREKPTPDEARYGIIKPRRARYWGEFDTRFDVNQEANEVHRHGWVVEIDPFDPLRRPVKRTALGRFKHEGAAPAVTKDGRVAFYMGDDEAFEYIYKFVTRRPWNKDDKRLNRDLLDDGTLYVAKFNADGTGEWLAIEHGKNGISADKGFADQGEVVIKARQAADVAGATPMDRPEWTAVNPATGEVFCTLTNCKERGEKPGARFEVNAANPRKANEFGHIIRWVEEGGDAAATRFRWDIFVLAGDPNQSAENLKGNMKGDMFGAPDGLLIDPRGRLWICTDVSPTSLGKGAAAVFGNNQMLAADLATREVRRFLVGPPGCEITGPVLTPDGTTLFVNIQHPGETPEYQSDPKEPRKASNWPDFRPDGRPRSATLAIRRKDGGIIGA